MELSPPFKLLKWDDKPSHQGYDGLRRSHAYYICIQGDNPNTWFSPNKDQESAIIKFESEVNYLFRNNEGPGRDKKEWQYGNYVIHLVSAESYYIGQKNGKWRKVLKIPTHKGAVNGHATMSSNVAANIGSLGAIYDKIAL